MARGESSNACNKANALAHDQMDALIHTLADHHQYHSNLVYELNHLLSSAQTSPPSQKNSTSKRQHNSLQSNGHVAKQVKRLVNQTLNTLTQWSKVLNAPNSSDVVPREKKSALSDATTAMVMGRVAPTPRTARSGISGSAPTSIRLEATNKTTSVPASKQSAIERIRSKVPTSTLRDTSSSKTLVTSAGGSKTMTRSQAGSSLSAPVENATTSQDSIYNSEQPTYEHVEILVDAGFLSISTLESIEAKSSASLLEVEKARSNMITKIVHLGMKKRALLELEILRERLMECAIATWGEDKDSQSRFKTGTHIKLLPPSSSAAALKETYQHLFTFPLPISFSSGQPDPAAMTPEPFQTFSLLVLAVFNNAVRCWMDVRNGSMAYLLQDMLSQPESPYEWCLHLAMFQRQAAAQQLDAIFRLLFIAAGKAAEISPLREGQRHAFGLRMLGMRYHAAHLHLSDSSDRGLIWDKIMRCGVEHDRSTRTAQSQEDVSFIAMAYKEIYEFVRDLAVIDLSDARFRKWHSHFVFFASKLDDTSLHTFSQSILGLGKSMDMTKTLVREPQPGTLSHHQSSRTLVMECTTTLNPPSTTRPITIPVMHTSPASAGRVFDRLDQAVKALRMFEDSIQAWNAGSLSEKELDCCLGNTRGILLSLEQDLSSFPSDGVASATLTNIARIFRSMDNLRSVGSKALDRREKELAARSKDDPALSATTLIGPPEIQLRSLSSVQLLIQILSDLTADLWSRAKSSYMTWYNANPSSTPDPAKLSCARVDAILFIFRLHQSGIIEASNPAAKPILAYLESAYGMAIDMNDLESMRWVSNAFYNYGGALFKSGKQKEAIRPLEAAIQCLRSSLGTELSADHSPDKVDRLEGGNRSKAEAREQLANRYEVLGVCFLAINDLERALESFNSGLCALPMSSFKQIDTVAQRDMRTSLLPAAKLLIRRSRTMLMMEGSQFRSVVTSVPEFEAKITRPDVPMHMKGIVQEYECGLLSVLSVRTNQATRRHEDQIGILKHLILRVYRGGRALVHPVRRARVLVQLAAVYQGSADLALQQEALNLIKEAIEILKERDLEHDQDLELVRNHHLAMAYSWQGILDRHQAENGQVRKSKPFQIALQLWEMIVCKIECFVSAEDSRLLERAELERVRRQLPEPELLFDHLRMLADCLGMVDYRVMQVQIYLLMLRLCNGVLPISEATCADAVRIYARMGQAYLALGYSGKAKMALNHGKLVLEEMARTSDDSSLRGEVYAAWLLAHSLYLTSVGHKDQSVTAYNQAKYYSDLHQNHPSLITGRTELWNGATISKKVEAKVNWAMILVEASLARSQLLYHEGDLSEAISDAMRAYRQLCRIVGTLSSAIKAAQKDSTLIYQQPLENPFLVQAEAEAEAPTDGMSSASQHHQRQQAKQERPSTETKQLRQGLELLATQRYQWSIFRLIIETFHQLSKLYLVQGSAREAEFFVLEGKHIALLSRAGKSVDRFLLDQAQLGLRKHQWTESQNILQELVSQEDKSNAGALNWEIHDARIQLLYGDLYFATGRIDRSLQAYYRTDEVLSHLMDKSFISGLEQLVIREPQTPREKRLATVYHHQGMRQVRSLSSVTLHSQDTDGGAGDQAQFECVVLSGIKAAMGYRTSIIFGRLGQRTEAYGLIEKSKAEDPKAFTAAEYHSVKAKMLMLELEDAMAKHLMYAMIPDSALSVGLFKKTRTQQPAPPPTFCTQPPYLEDHMAPPSLMMHAPMDMDPISSSPSVRVTRMTRRRRSQLVNQQLHSPLHSRSTGPSGCGTRSLGEGVNMNSYLRMLTQAKEHLSEAYRYSVKACPPHIIADICGRQAYLAILESCFHQDLEEAAGANIVDEMGATLDVSKENHGSDYSLWRMANRASCYLETAKAVTQRREMYGLIKQKLNPALPQEDQTWPRDIQIKSPEHSHSQRMHQQWTQPPTSGPRKGIRTERRGRKTINYSGLEKPRRLRLQMTDDDDDVALHARIGADVDDEDEEIDEDLEVLGMKPKDLKTRRGYRHYLDQQQLLHPSTSLGNERSFLEALEMAYGQDLDIHDGDHAENFQQDFVDILPEKWTVVSISMDVERETLYVNRLRANAMPVVVRLPLNRAQLREGDDQELGFRLGSGMGSTGLDDEEESPQGEPLSYKDAVEELEDILAGSQETLDIGSFASSATGSSTFARPGHDQTIELTREIKAEWWSRRQRLDDRLCALLGTMEDQWLCGLKGLIQSHNTPADSENLLGFKRTLEWIMSHAVNSMSSFSATQGRGSHSGASAQGSWIQLEVNIELCRVILHLGDQPSFLELKDLIYFLLDAYLYKSVSVSASTAPIFAAPSSPSMGRGFEHASSPRSASTASTTTPAPYIEYSEIQFGRIAMQIKEALRCYWLAETEAKNNGFDEGAHVILILDKHLQAFPWESCPALRGEAVSRMPSIWFLRDRILQQRFLASTSKQEQKQEQEQDLRQQLEEWKDLEVDPQRTFYILNPTGDLKNTEREFETYVQSQEGWDGIIGRVPLSLEYMNALSKNELYIYFGHSGGEQYIKTSQIRQLGHCAVSLLLGCSSGSLKGSGEFDPTGNAMNYLLAGCPTLVANLWDVTDRDLDRFSKALFSLWGLDDNCRGRSTSQSESRREGDEGESMEDIAGEGTEDVGEQSLRRNNERLKLSIVEAVKEARDECRLKYLVGAATVVYGIPCFLKRSPRRV